jgi:hypothetical protein
MAANARVGAVGFLRPRANPDEPLSTLMSSPLQKSVCGARLGALIYATFGPAAHTSADAPLSYVLKLLIKSVASF